ncbi:hypothetical protein D3C73_651610 [compost metagenome]
MHSLQQIDSAACNRVISHTNFTYWDPIIMLLGHGGYRTSRAALTELTDIKGLIFLNSTRVAQIEDIKGAICQYILLDELICP